MQVAGRNVVITGASQGIGEQLARSFAARGAQVLVVARSADQLQALSEQIAGRWLAADLTDAAQLDGLVARCLEQLGTIDVWVNNAGMETADAFAHVDRHHLRQLARLNFEAPLLLTRDLLPHLLSRNEGHIVMLSSLAGVMPFPGMSAYAGTKAGVTHFTESLRLELTTHDIGLTVVAPGPVATEMWSRIDHRESWAFPALKRFDRLQMLPKLDDVALAEQIVDAVESGKRHVRPKNRYRAAHVLNHLPRQLVQASLAGVRHPPIRLDSGAAGATAGSAAPRAPWQPIWPTDNPPSRRWPLYTRGNIGEVFPEVVLPLTWDTFGGAAERGWRQAYRNLGLLVDGDFDDDEDMVILGVIGGYGYINAGFVRMLGVRAPGGSVAVVDRTIFGESDAPAYRPRPGDKNLASTVKLGRTVFRLLGTKSQPELEDDKALAAAYVDRYPGDDADDASLLEYFFDLEPIFERLFARHIDNSFSAVLVAGALSDLCVKAGKPHLLVSILAGIGEVESAAPSAAMWSLARAAQAEPALAAAFDAGVPGLLDRLAGLAEADGWRQRFDAFLDEYGSRGPNEWDIGSDPWALRPELALAAIDRMRAVDDSHDPARQAGGLRARRETAVAEVRAALNPIDRLQFDKALRATTVLSQGRERSKTTIIRAVHGARVAQAELARRIAARGGPVERWHTCLYTSAELPQAVDDPSTLADVIAERVALHGRLSRLIPPFIVDDGIIPDPSTWQSRDQAGPPVVVGDTFNGIAGCPGVARGRARVVLDPGQPGDLGPGDVLVAPITDPSWTPLFLAADAVVVDVGATMSHAVIVSRELGIPCVVSALGATTRITDGALIEVDGSTGTVTVLEVPAGVPA
ncbi:MAG: SDR family NAD(P)-dependent oxidoreductase [Acidimicrobiia bacterium]